MNLGVLVEVRLRDARRLLGSKKLTSSQVLESLASNGDEALPGCYVIWDRNDRQQPLYVGMANNWILGRLKKAIRGGHKQFRNHLADWTLKLKDLDQKMKTRLNEWIERECLFQYLTFKGENAMLRAETLEMFCISVLVPRLNEIG